MEIALQLLVEEALQGDKGSDRPTVSLLHHISFSFRLQAIKKKED